MINNIMTKKLAILLSIILAFSFVPVFNVNAIEIELNADQYTVLEIPDGHTISSTSQSSQNFNAADSKKDYGDVNNDKTVDEKDIKILQRYFTKQYPVIVNFMAADMDDDNDVDIFDIIYLKRLIAYGIYPNKAPVITTPVVTTSITVSTQITTTTVTTNTTEPIEKAYASEVLKLVNEERAAVGKKPLILNEKLCDAAMIRANEIVEKFSHTRPNETDCFTILYEKDISFSSAGENIAGGRSTPSGVMDQWVNSKGHYENIISSDFTDIGIGYVYDPYNKYQYYWVQMFIGN